MRLTLARTFIAVALSYNNQTTNIHISADFSQVAYGDFFGFQPSIIKMGGFIHPYDAAHLGQVRCPR